MSYSTQSGNVEGTDRYQLYRLAPAIVKLPGPSQSWTLAAARKHHDVQKLNGQKLRESSLFEATGKRASEDPGKNQKLWRTTRSAYRAAQEIESRDGLLPCGHDGFVNVGNSQLECKRCGAVHDRSEVRDDG